MSRDDTGEAEFKGKEVLLMSKGDTGEAESQVKEVLIMSKDATGEAESQDKRGARNSPCLGALPAGPNNSSRRGARCSTCSRPCT